MLQDSNEKDQENFQYFIWRATYRKKEEMLNPTEQRKTQIKETISLLYFEPIVVIEKRGKNQIKARLSTRRL